MTKTKIKASPKTATKKQPPDVTSNTRKDQPGAEQFGETLRHIKTTGVQDGHEPKRFTVRLDDSLWAIYGDLKYERWEPIEDMPKDGPEGYRPDSRRVPSRRRPPVAP